MKQGKQRSQDIEDKIKNDPLLALAGSGKEFCADEHADEYVKRIREGWDDLAPADFRDDSG